MITHQNDCSGCAVPGYPCWGVLCEYANRPQYICDCCKEEVEPGELYWLDDRQLCGQCVLENLEVVRDE